MESNAKLSRRSLSLGNRINKRLSDTHLQKHLANQVVKENEENQIQEPTTPSEDVALECTPPHKKYSLDESIEYSPAYLNYSFSPGSLYSQTVGANSEVSWQWGNTNNKSNENRTSDSALTDLSFSTAEAKAKDILQCAQSKREEQLRAIEYKIRRAETLRADEALKRRCAKFKQHLREAERHIQKDTTLKNVKTNALLEDASIKSVNTVQEEFIESHVAADFFDDSAEDNFLLEATEQVEHEIIKLTQQSAVTINAENSADNRHNNTTERRTSMYSKFFEDDAQDDLFGSFDDIIEQAMQTTKPRNSFQRFNSMPVESMSATSKTVETVREVPITSKPQTNSTIVTQAIKRHASSQDVPIYHPYKMKQIKRR